MKILSDVKKAVGRIGAVEEVSSTHYRVTTGRSGFSYRDLLELSKFFKTENIQIEVDYSSGCPTCGPDIDTVLEIYLEKEL